jgi:hypothetical protein
VRDSTSLPFHLAERTPLPSGIQEKLRTGYDKACYLKKGSKRQSSLLNNLMKITLRKN